MSKSKKVLWGIIMTVIVLTLMVYFLIHRALSPYWQARGEAIIVAESQENLKDPDKFYWHNGNETVFSITGKDSNDRGIMVIIREEEGQTSRYYLDEIFSEEEAISQLIEDVQPAEVLEARVTFSEDDGPLWEVGFKDSQQRLGYYLISLIDGAWIKTIDNI